MQHLCTIRNTCSFGQLLGILCFTCLEGCITDRSGTLGRVKWVSKAENSLTIPLCLEYVPTLPYSDTTLSHRLVLHALTLLPSTMLNTNSSITQRKEVACVPQKSLMNVTL